MLYRYPSLLPYTSATEGNKLADEFLQYQLMNENDIPADIWESELTVQDEETRHYRMDVVWSYMLTMKSTDGDLLYQRLAKVALLVLTLPHSNAEEERILSLVTKNKTKFRPNLKLDGTLSSILTIKLANPEPCQKFEPTQEILQSSKKATSECNKAHSSKNQH